MVVKSWSKRKRREELSINTRLLTRIQDKIIIITIHLQMRRS